MPTNVHELEFFADVLTAGARAGLAGEFPKSDESEPSQVPLDEELQLPLPDSNAGGLGDAPPVGWPMKTTGGGGEGEGIDTGGRGGGIITGGVGDGGGTGDPKKICGGVGAGGVSTMIAGEGGEGAGSSPICTMNGEGPFGEATGGDGVVLVGVGGGLTQEKNGDPQLGELLLGSLAGAGGGGEAGGGAGTKAGSAPPHGYGISDKISYAACACTTPRP